MDHGISEALLLSLVMVIETITGTPRPDTLPAIQRLPAVEIALTVCGAPCPVKAAYIRERGILIDDALDLDHDSFAQSILVHELVHAAQDREGLFAELPVCRRHIEREYHAYWVQNEYLRRIGASRLIGLYKGNRLWPRCFDD